MTAEEMTMQELRKQVSELTLRLKELGEEHRDLRELCNERGIQYAERLAARRHKRYFADLCEKHPLGGTTTASDVYKRQVVFGCTDASLEGARRRESRFTRAM